MGSHITFSLNICYCLFVCKGVGLQVLSTLDLARPLHVVMKNGQNNIYLWPKVTLHCVYIYIFRLFMRDIRKLFNSY